jgi:hypothetical protein
MIPQQETPGDEFICVQRKVNTRVMTAELGMYSDFASQRDSLPGCSHRREVSGHRTPVSSHHYANSQMESNDLARTQSSENIDDCVNGYSDILVSNNPSPRDLADRFHKHHDYQPCLHLEIDVASHTGCLHTQGVCTADPASSGIEF